MKKLLGWTLGVLGALVLAVLLVLAFPPTGWIAGKVEDIVAERTGYALRIGALELDLLDGTPSAALSSVAVDGGQLPGLLEGARAEAAIDLGAALGGEIVIDRVALSDATVRLERDADGATSWAPGTIDAVEPDPEADPDGDPLALPTIRELSVENVDVVWSDAVTDTRAQLAVAAEGSTLPGRTPLGVTVDGTANGAPVQAELQLESALEDALAGGPVESALDASTDGASLALAGRVGDPAALGAIDLQLDADIDSLGAIETVLGTELPAFAPATLAATLRTSDGGLVLVAGGDVGGEPLRASLALDPEAPLADALSGQVPVVLDLEASVGRAGIDVAGSIGEPASLGDVDLRLQADIDALAAAEGVLDTELPELAPASLEATLRSEGEGLVLRADGSVDGEPVAIVFDLDSRASDALAGGPVRLDLAAAVGGASVALSGSVGELATLGDADLALDVDIGSLSAVEKLAGAELPELDSASLSATVQSDGDGLEVRAEGTVDGEPVQASVQLDSSVDDVLAGDPLQLDLDASAGGARVRVSGSVADLTALDGVDLQLDADIESLAAVETLLGTDLPDIEPASLDGALTSDGDELVLNDLDAAFAGSTLTGDVRVDPTTGPPTVYATLESPRFDVDALLAALGIGTEEVPADERVAETEPVGPVLPSEPLPVDLLFGTAQGAVALRVDEVAWELLPVGSLDARAEIAAGRTSIDIDDLGLAGGDIDATLVLTPKGEAVDDAEAIDAKLDATLSRVAVARLLPDYEVVDDTGGPLGGEVELWASGDSIAALAGSLDGGVLLLMGRGRLDALPVELAGLDLFQSLGDLLEPTEDVFEIRCAYASLSAREGVVTVDDFVLDSSDTVFLAEGSVDLGAETLDLLLEPHPKDPSLLAATTGVTLGGTFAELEFGVTEELALRTAAAAALAAVATPAAALLPFIQVGGAEDSGFCALEGALDGDAG